MAFRITGGTQIAGSEVIEKDKESARRKFLAVSQDRRTRQITGYLFQKRNPPIERVS